MLNRSKGPAVHSLRAQADKNHYSRTMRQVLENEPNIEIKQTEVVNILTEEGKVSNSTIHFILNILRQRTRHTADIHFICFQSFRFNKNLMPRD